MNTWLILVVLNVYLVSDMISTLNNFYRSNKALINQGKEPLDYDTINLMFISYTSQFVTMNILGILGSLLWSYIPAWWEVGLFVTAIMLAINMTGYIFSFIYVHHVTTKRLLEEMAKAKQEK